MKIFGEEIKPFDGKFWTLLMILVVSVSSLIGIFTEIDLGVYKTLVVMGSLFAFYTHTQTKKEKGERNATIGDILAMFSALLIVIFTLRATVPGDVPYFGNFLISIVIAIDTVFKETVRNKL